MRVSIVGAGYVGLVTAACLAEEGIDVVCVDVDPTRVEQVRSGISPIHEPGLVELLERNAGGRLRATVDMRDAVLDTDLTLIAVGTPSTDGGYRPLQRRRRDPFDRRGARDQGRLSRRRRQEHGRPRHDGSSRASRARGRVRQDGRAATSGSA